MIKEIKITLLGGYFDTIQSVEIDSFTIPDTGHSRQVNIDDYTSISECSTEMDREVRQKLMSIGWNGQFNINSDRGWVDGYDYGVFRVEEV